MRYIISSAMVTHVVRWTIFFSYFFSLHFLPVGLFIIAGRPLNKLSWPWRHSSYCCKNNRKSSFKSFVSASYQHGKKDFLIFATPPLSRYAKTEDKKWKKKMKREKNVENVTIRIRQRIHFSNGIRKSRSFLSASAIRWKRKTENSSRGLGTRYVKPKVYKVFFIFSFEKIVNRAQLSTVNINSLYVFQHFLLFRFFFVGQSL